MRKTDVIVIGAGHSGLAMSQVLGARGIDHIVLERGRIAEKWRSARWDSLRLLSPNWCARLPGRSYAGPDPDGFMSMAEVTRYFDDYARDFGAPVLTGVEVGSVAPCMGGWLTRTTQGEFRSRAVVIATGHCDVPHVPGFARMLPGSIRHLTPTAYRNPGALPAGGVLVVGASASGVQIADELRAAGREVTLSAGSHTRLPRRYRGRDIFWWMDAMGVLEERIERHPNPVAARRQPSLQLVGDPSRERLDLGTLARDGVRIAGRTLGVGGGVLRFADDLAENVADAERRLIRLRGRIDAFIDATGIEAPAAPAYLGSPVTGPVTEAAPTRLDLKAEGIGTVIWATGFRRDYRWLKAPVLDACGELRHQGGVLPAPGLYAMGLRFMRRRNSSFIDGAAGDAMALADRIVHQLDDACRVAV